ncbi:Protein CBG16831 [Caenorhabditis briggsae]|uniref:Uncharacterized protein n=2 Tax=Caenorhabditis briggsae TaxID=6238 RepID=A0AAE8ZPC1_CAEBR|nr:Protein CBG16831 [Caenorhabditis briggsae]ULT83274.1 hypothetical protein L3Y34_012489 [Caenorhabditis briggsae]UMM42556.1 hypothetical protein L5515_018345 [Caenorhabditis briggsae]CAP34694.1 Protein CBG16831 [Caenorhabditis briggsae]
MLRIGHFFLLVVLVVAVLSIPTSYSKSKMLNNIFKQIHNKKAVGDTFPYEAYGFGDAGYGLGDEQNYFVIV